MNMSDKTIEKGKKYKYYHLKNRIQLFTSNIWLRGEKGNKASLYSSNDHPLESLIVWNGVHDSRKNVST